jgi:hypothetical protein
MQRAGNRTFHIITAVILTAALIISVVPLGAGSAKAAGIRSVSYMNKRSAGKFVHAKIAGKTVMAAPMDADVKDDTLEEIRDSVRDYIMQLYDTYIMDESLYSGDVLKEIKASYSKMLRMIDEAEYVSDLYTTDDFFAELAPAISDEADMLETLSYQIRHYVKDNADISKYVKRLKSELAELKKDAKKSDFNDFYWGRLQNCFADASGSLSKVKNIRDYVIAVSEILGWEADAVMSIYYEDSGESGEDDEEDEEDYSDEDILISLLPDEDSEIILILYEDSSEYILNKSEVEAIRATQTEIMKAYIDKLSGKQISKNTAAKLKKQIDAFKKNRLNKIEDAEKIRNESSKKLRDMMASLGISTGPLTKRKYIRVARQYNAMTSNYSRNDYSEKRWLQVESAFFRAKSAIEEAEYDFELDGVIAFLAKKLKAIPKADKEFAGEMKKIKKKLKSFTKGKKKKKYRQKKVKKVIKKGFKALAKVEKNEVEKLQEVGEAYIEKAEACIKTFRITVRKKGKGRVTKSSKVEYGESFTVTIAPKAGYKIKKVTIDGKKKKLKNSYTFKKVKKKHKVKVVFGK